MTAAVGSSTNVTRYAFFNSTVASMLLVPPGLAALPSFLVSVVTALLGLPIGPGSFF